MERKPSQATKVTEHDRRMAEKRDLIIADPEVYFASARKTAYREEMRRVLKPWTKRRTRLA